MNIVLALSICNSALLKVGANAITSFSEGTPESIVCDAHYNRCRLTPRADGLFWCSNAVAFDYGVMNFLSNQDSKLQTRP